MSGVDDEHVQLLLARLARLQATKEAAAAGEKPSRFLMRFRRLWDEFDAALRSGAAPAAVPAPAQLVEALGEVEHARRLRRPRPPPRPPDPERPREGGERPHDDGGASEDERDPLADRKGHGHD